MLAVASAIDYPSRALQGLQDRRARHAAASQRVVRLRQTREV